MSTSQSQTEVSRKVVQDFYANGIAGNFGDMLSCLDENLVVIEPPFLFYGGRYEGIPAFQALFAEVGQYVDVSSMKVESLVADGDVVVVFMTARVVKTNDVVQIGEYSRVSNGKIVEMKIYYHDAGALLSAKRG